MNRKERRNLQRQGVQVPKDPTLNIKLSALGKSIMTPEMQMAMMHEINQQCLEKDDLLGCGLHGALDTAPAPGLWGQAAP